MATSLTIMCTYAKKSLFLVKKDHLFIYLFAYLFLEQIIKILSRTFLFISGQLFAVQWNIL